MKKITAIALALVMLLSLCACAKETGLDAKDLQLSEYAQLDINDRVQLFIKQRTVTDTTGEIAIALENLSEADFTFDAVQRLEVLLDGQWYVVPDKSDAVTMQLFHLPAGSTEETSFFFGGHYDELGEGTYRIVKLLVDAEGNTAVAAAEFTIGQG